MCRSVVLHHKVNVVGADKRNVVACGQFAKLAVDLHLIFVDVLVALVTRGVELHFEIVVVAKDFAELQHRSLGTLQVATHNELGNLATQASRAADKSLAI